MELYIDAAKSYIQLSTGALFLSVAFYRQILGNEGPLPASPLLGLSWVCFLISIGAGALYQYLAVKYLEVRYAPDGAFYEVRPRFLMDHPGVVYGLMLLAFYAGAVLFGIRAIEDMF